MKTFTKNISIILTLLTLANCGLAHNWYVMGYDFSGIGPHPYRVTKEIESSPTKNGLGITNLSFRVDDGDKDYNGANTIWRKINDNGTFGKHITLTYLQIFKQGKVRVALEPGTYFMDGVRFIAHNKGSNMQTNINVGAFTELWSNKQKGWDSTKKQARWFEFTVKAGQEVHIPEIFVFGHCKSGNSNCDGDDFVLRMTIKDNKNTKSNDYKFGSEVLIK